MIEKIGRRINALAKTSSFFLYFSNLRKKCLMAHFQRVDTGSRAVQKRNLGGSWVGHEADVMRRDSIPETVVRRSKFITPPLLWSKMRMADLMAAPTKQMRKLDPKTSQLETHRARDTARFCVGPELPAILVEFLCIVERPLRQ